MKFRSKYDIGDTVTIEQENGKSKVLITEINATKISGRDVGISYVGETTTPINFCEDAITGLVALADNIEQVNPEVSKKTPDGINIRATPNEINVKVDSYKAALKYLGRENFTKVNALPGKHANALVAIYKLITIAEAWNKADEFVPDFSNCNQDKWFPWFEYNRAAAGFVYSTTLHTSTSTIVGSRLCFKTEERATQFGKQFIDLWNDFLLFR